MNNQNEIIDNQVEDTEDTEAESERKSKQSKRERKRENTIAIFEWLEMFTYAFGVVIILLAFVGRYSPVSGTSMVPTLQDGDVLIVSSLFYTPKQGDIIVAQSEPLGYNEPIVKRVIATEGQTVDIDFTTWTVTVDGEVLDEDYINYIPNASMRQYYDGMTFPLTVDEGCLFVMGDNRNGSLDSRSTQVGLIDVRNVVGHVVFRLYPLSTFGVPQ